MRHRDIVDNGFMRRVFYEDFDEKQFDGMVKEIFTHPVYQTNTVGIGTGDVVIDGGGAVGLFAIWALNRGAKVVYSYDPNYRRINSLEETIKFNQLGGRLVPIFSALWHTRMRSLPFHFNRANPLGGRIIQERHNAELFVPAETIDDLGGRVDFIKLDVEGSELNALMGASETLIKYKPKLAVSLYHKRHDHDLISKFLKYEFGYSAPEISSGKYKVGIWYRAN
jgi:FkbM family methyltransferase